MAEISQLKQSELLSLSEDFDLTLALNGNLVDYTITDDDGNVTLHTGTLKTNINASVAGQYGAVYAVKDGNLELYFDRQGNCVSPEYTGKDVKLKNVEATLPTFDTNKVSTTRASGDTVTTATINAIRPIDQFAIAIIQPLLEKMTAPQEVGAADILKWSAVAYQWAQGMFSIATTYRTANDSEVSTNSDSVKTSIDNAVKALNSITTEIKSKSLDTVVSALNSVNNTVKNKDMGAKDTVTVKMSDTVRVDNPTDDKFQVDGAGGITYDGLNDVGENVSSFPVFNDKALSRATLANVAKKILALDTTLDWLRKLTDATIWMTYASAIHTAIKASIDSDIDAKLTQFATDYNLTKS